MRHHYSRKGALTHWSRYARLLSAALMMVALAACGSRGHSSAPKSTATKAPSTSAGPNAAAALQQAFVAVVTRIRPQVVEISTSTDLGSGVVYDRQGDIVTNAHVVGTATTFKVSLDDGQNLSAILVGTYPSDDLAVIRVQGGHNLTPATFGSSNPLRIGDIVFAVGNPLGLASSVTEGIVSYNGRTVSEGNGVTLPSTIQTSAPINPGNSGGALVDLSGQVIGIPTLAGVDPEEGGAAPGIGFAIPSDVVRKIVPQLIASGHITAPGRAALGVVASDAIDALGEPVGVLIDQVEPGGPAAKAGIRAGDVLVAIDAQPVSSLADLQNVLAGLSPGSKVQLTVTDQAGNQKTVTVTLGQLPSP